MREKERQLQGLAAGLSLQIMPGLTNRNLLQRHFRVARMTLPRVLKLTMTTRKKSLSEALLVMLGERKGASSILGRDSPSGF